MWSCPYHKPSANGYRSRDRCSCCVDEDGEPKHEEGRYVRVRLPRQVDQPVLTPTADGKGTLRFVHRASVAEEINSGKGIINTEPHRYHYSVLVMVPGGAAKWPWVLPTLLDSGSDISFIGESGPICMQKTWPGVQRASPY